MDCHGVAPLAGAWIEISCGFLSNYCIIKSLPSRERGLKYGPRPHFVVVRIVAPLAGAWIEINTTRDRVVKVYVAPLAGAWIEITNSKDREELLDVAPLAGAWIEIPMRNSRN